MNITSTWNAELDDRLVRARREGLSFAQAAERIGVTRDAALGRFARINKTRFPSQERRRVEKMEETKRAKEAFEQKQARALEMFDTDLASGMDRDDAMVAAINRGCGRVALAKRLGISRERVRQIVDL